MAKNIMRRLFRKADRATICSESGTAECRCIITKDREEVFEYRQEAVGRFSNINYVYWGDRLPEKGDYISWHGHDYLVLKAEEISAFGTSLCARAVLERMI